MAEEPSTPPPKKGRRRRVADLSGLASAWEADKDVRKGARKRKSLLQWKDPTKVGLIGFNSIKDNWKVILHLISIYCPDSPPSKTVPVDDVKPEVEKFYEDIYVTPKSGLVHCESHSLKMFITFLNRRHDGSSRKDNRLRALFDELAKHWPPKPRSKRSLVSGEDQEEEDYVEAYVWVWLVG
ncbi:unnamed protein product [Symbiodinium necroappetens]|uniref:Uncharacterized protein n=1 Tax=Symbiodinium necroappetens TaxID=1628268 RepID=A0A813BFZ9_9DINO|nr:unnamed protein product [Symbiodinium necroappetens]